jgi:hypothetical protein
MDVSTRREALYDLLGDLPPRQRPISAELVSAGEFDGYWLETLSLDLNGIEPVPAFFARRPWTARRRRCSTTMPTGPSGRSAKRS